MPRALIIHNTLNSCGGGERLALAMIETLKKMGFHVVLGTVEPTDWERVAKLMSACTRPDEERPLLPFKLQAFGLYTRLLTFMHLLKGRYDLTINTHGDLIPLPTDLVYMHFPTVLVREFNPAKYSSGPWRLYYEGYRSLQMTLKYSLRRSVVLTNSRFSACVIRRLFNVKPVVLYPPVDVHKFSRASAATHRENAVLSLGRFTPEKNYEFVLEVARRLRHVKFYIVGAASGRVSSGYLRKLSLLKKRLNLDNVKFVVNAPDDLLLDLMGRSKVYLHTMVNEHFGVAVVEAMAAGLVPVVHKSGGPWFDIVRKGLYGYGYTTAEEASEAVEEALARYEELKDLARTRARFFSRRAFEERFSKVVEVVMQAR